MIEVNHGFTSKCFPVRGASSFVATHAGILMDGRSDFQRTSICSKTALPPLKFPDVESLSSGPGTFPSKDRYSDRESREGLIERRADLFSKIFSEASRPGERIVVRGKVGQEKIH